MSAPSTPHFRRALFVRLDRIGDLVLSLPTDQALTIDQVDWWIPEGLSFVTDSALPPRNAAEMPKSIPLTECYALARLVREKHYDLAVIFHAPWWVSFVIWLARVPLRIGVQSQWHSFLYLNRAVRQKRSLAEHSELEYNYQLLEKGLGLAPSSLTRSTLKLRAKSGPQKWLQAGLAASKYVVVHPGMGGSAMNWSTDKYADLIHELAHESKVAITGTASDETFLAPLKKKIAKRDPDLASRVVWLDSRLSGTELIDVLQNARAVIAPSTGVLHLAASTGRPTVGIFSNVKVERALRWGPKGEHTVIVEPPHSADPATCMELITVPQVLKALSKLVHETDSSHTSSLR